MSNPDEPKTEAEARRSIREIRRRDFEEGQQREVSEYLSLYPEFESAVMEEIADLERSLLRNQSVSTTNEAATETMGASAGGPDLADGGIPAQLGPYRLTKEIGRGGQGRVFIGEDQRLDRKVAIKVLTLRDNDHGMLARFHREARLAAKVGGNGICKVYDVGLDSMTPWIAMEFVPGHTLASMIQRARDGGGDASASFLIAPPFAADPTTRDERASTRNLGVRVRKIMALVEEIARVLHRAHEAKVLHRDLKPGNIMIRPDGTPVLLDFGLASSEEDPVELTQTGDLFGTPAYLAPEQVENGSSAASVSTDVWSLGVVLHECLTGERPFRGASRKAVFNAITKAEPQPDLEREQGIPSDLALVASAALRKDPNDRYATALDFADDLRCIIDQRPIRVRPVPRRVKLCRWVQRNRAVTASLAAAFISLIAGLVVSSVQARRAEDALTEWERLADAERLRTALVQGYSEIIPAWPEHLARAEAWVSELEALAAGLPDHELAAAQIRTDAQVHDVTWTSKAADQHRALRAEYDLLTLRRIPWLEETIHAYRSLRGLPPRFQGANTKRFEDLQELYARGSELEALLRNPVQPAHRWGFSSPSDQLRHDQLTQLIEDLRALRTRTDLVRPGLPSARELVAMMKASQKSAEITHRDAWAAVRERVAASETYGQLDLAVQSGLVPLGPDPDSGLEEFGHLHSGELPVRDESGHLTMAEDTGLIFVLLPGGAAQVGSWPLITGHNEQQPHVDSRSGFRARTTPSHRVLLAPFLISKYEVTKTQWARMARDRIEPSMLRHSHVSPLRGPRTKALLASLTRVEVGPLDTRPADQLDWSTARQVLRVFGWELPTESQWEYACRAGSARTFPWGDDEGEHHQFANLLDAAHAAGYKRKISDDSTFDGHAYTAPVGSYKPNAFGLYDMIGNVSEWCLDVHSADAYGIPPRAGDGLREPLDEDGKIVKRGGNFLMAPNSTGCAIRQSTPPSTRREDMGLRPARRLQ